MKDKLMIAEMVVSVLIAVLCFSEMMDLLSEVRKQEKNIEILESELDSQKSYTSELEQRIVILDSHVQFFIEGGWK